MEEVREYDTTGWTVFWLSMLFLFGMLIGVWIGSNTPKSEPDKFQNTLDVMDP